MLKWKWILKYLSCSSAKIIKILKWSKVKETFSDNVFTRRNPDSKGLTRNNVILPGERSYTVRLVIHF